MRLFYSAQNQRLAQTHHFTNIAHGFLSHFAGLFRTVGHSRLERLVFRTLGRLRLFEGERASHLLFAPGARFDVPELLADLTERLDAAKGYRDL